MAVKILIKRRFEVENMKAASSLLMKARYSATQQPGYLSSETLTGLKDPGRVVVASLWETEKAWNAWKESPARKEFTAELHKIQEGETELEYYVPGWQIEYE